MERPNRSILCGGRFDNGSSPGTGFLDSLRIKVEGNIMSKAEDGTPISGILGPEAGETLAVRDRRNQDFNPPIAWGLGKEWERDGGINTRAGHPKRDGISARQNEVAGCEASYPPTLSTLNLGVAHLRAPITERKLPTEAVAIRLGWKRAQKAQERLISLLVLF